MKYFALYPESNGLNKEETRLDRWIKGQLEAPALLKAGDEGSIDQTGSVGQGLERDF